jgi:hypothetical protein
MAIHDWTPPIVNICQGEEMGWFRSAEAECHTATVLSLAAWLRVFALENVLGCFSGLVSLTRLKKSRIKLVSVIHSHSVIAIISPAVQRLL